MGIHHYNSTDDKVKESWARGVQWALTRMRYPSYRGGATIRPDYTQVVVDMIDRHSTTNHNEESENIFEDYVTGYTIRQLEDALKGKHRWETWRDNIKNRYTNDFEDNLDALFNHWN